MSSKKKNGEGGSGERPQTEGSIAPQDEGLTLWLNKLWARGEPPERIELWQAFGKRTVRGEMIHHEDFKPNEKLTVEQVNKLANDLYDAAQNDCDSQPRPTKSTYQIAIIDRNRRSAPLTRRLGPILPKRAYLAQQGEDDEDEDDVRLDGKSLALKYIKESFEQTRWDKNRNDRVVGEMLILQHNIIQNQQGVIDKLFNGSITMFEKMQEAKDKELDRIVFREKEQFKLALYRDGLRTARNLLPGLFADKGGQQPQQQQQRISAPANGDGSTAAPDVGPSEERTLVDNFLSDIEEDEALAIALFGDFEERDGKLVQVKPGIFTLKQYTTLLGVREGRFPADKLDDLLPGSTHPDAIDTAQITAAQNAPGFTDGIGTAIVELVGLRSQRKMPAPPSESAQQPQPSK